MKLSVEAYELIMEALDISSSVKVYGDGREEHQKAIEEAKQEVEAIGTF